MIPIGTVMMFAGPSCPDGWLFCDGSEVDRVVYAALFTAIGTLYGEGNGSSTFNLPDFRSRSPVGKGQGVGLSDRGLGEIGGEEAHQLNTGEMPNHGGHESMFWDTYSQGANNFHPYSQDTGGDEAHNTMHPFLVVHFIICVEETTENSYDELVQAVRDLAFNGQKIELGPLTVTYNGISTQLTVS